MEHPGSLAKSIFQPRTAYKNGDPIELKLKHIDGAPVEVMNCSPAELRPEQCAFVGASVQTRARRS
jgi:hypothetical protein